MSDLRTDQLKQLNYLDKAITNLVRAMKVGEKQEELGYNNGKIANKVKELQEIYESQFTVENNPVIDSESTVGPTYVPSSTGRPFRGVF